MILELNIGRVFQKKFRIFLSQRLFSFQHFTSSTQIDANPQREIKAITCML